MKKLPIGLNSLENIINEGFLYVDKTKKIYKLIDSGRYFFLSRPRRFGKTLTVDTLKHIFEGNKELFKGLYIYDKWNWDDKFPVLRIDFSGGNFFSKEKFEERAIVILEKNERWLGVNCTKKDPSNCFEELILKTYDKYNKPVVVLIDEYDKPILDNIEKPELAEEIRDLLSNFYGVLKGLDEYLRFVFLTGVTKFSKVNLFSKLNNLEDITVDENYSDLCGYTEGELDKYFSEYLKGANREEVRKWYNGYSWLGESVYNPFDILLFIKKGLKFRPYWFETGSPTFLIKLMKEKKYFIPELEDIKATDELFGSFDVYTMEVEALLWQTGYLTIKSTRKRLDNSLVYKLSYPNLEVKKSLNNVLLKYLSSLSSDPRTGFQDRLEKYLIDGNVDGLVESFRSLFSSISYTNFTKNEIAGYEGFYASVIYSFLSSLGVDLIAEDVTNKGRIDLTILIPDKAYIIEFKVDMKEDPLKQIKEKRYFEKYENKVKEIYLIGINFSKADRNIKDFKYEVIKMND